ncbi:MAG: WD40 repeat domain-containing protein, partial [Moorea sp. SIO3C2]|nr:WD40 repeat domain-containing protein [Moorena sp. SIO3C2]
MLTNFDFIEAKVLEPDLGAQPLIEDYELAFNSEHFKDDENFKDYQNNLRAIQSALQRSVQTIIQDKTQLAGQLIGRLLSSESSTIQKMLEQAQHWKATDWLCPMTPSLTIADNLEIKTLKGHREKINLVAITPDEKLVISASNDHTLKVWDLDSGTELFTLIGHTNRVNSVAIMPDGQQALSASSDGTLKIWDLKQGKLLQDLDSVGIPTDKTLSWPGNLNEGITAAAVTPDGTKAICALSEEKTLKIWDIERNRELHIIKGNTDWTNAIAVTPDGKRAISAADSFEKTLKVWDLESGQELFTLSGHKAAIWSVAVTPDGKKAISASDDKNLKVWDLENGEALYTLSGHEG